MAIDWNKPLQAIEFGRDPTAAKLITNDGSGVMAWRVNIEETDFWAEDDGDVPGTPWTIRNRE